MFQRRTFLSLTTLAAVILFFMASLIEPPRASGYNEYDFQCSWSNPSGSYLYVNWKWGPNINVSGGWANDFRLGSSAWSNAGTKLRLGYSSAAVSDVDTYYAV